MRIGHLSGICLLSMVLGTGLAIYTPSSPSIVGGRGVRGRGGGGGVGSPNGSFRGAERGRGGARGGLKRGFFGSSRGGPFRGDRGGGMRRGAGAGAGRGASSCSQRGERGGDARGAGAQAPRGDVRPHLRCQGGEDINDDDEEMEEGERPHIPRAPGFLRAYTEDVEDEEGEAEEDGKMEGYKIPGKGYVDPSKVDPDPDIVDQLLNDPECGLPTDEEMQEIFERQKQGLQLSFRQTVWFQAFSDPITLYGSAEAMRRNRPTVSMLNESFARGDEPLHILNDQLPLGCMDLDNCTDCIQRYNGTIWHFPPEEDMPKTEEEKRTRVEDNFSKLRKDWEDMWNNEDDDTLGQFGFDMEAARPTQVTPEFEARHKIHSRMFSTRDSGVSDGELKKALKVVNPQMWQGREMTKTDLSAEMARLRKKFDQPIDDVIEGEVCEGEVTSVRPYGLIVQIEPSGRKALVHLSQVSKGYCTVMEDRIRSEANGNLVEDIKIGDSVRVIIVKVDEMMHYSIEASRKACPSRPGEGGGTGGTAGESYSSWQRGSSSAVHKKVVAAEENLRIAREEQERFQEELDVSSEDVMECLRRIPMCEDGDGRELFKAIGRDVMVGKEAGERVVEDKRQGNGLQKARKTRSRDGIPSDGGSRGDREREGGMGGGGGAVTGEEE